MVQPGKAQPWSRAVMALRMWGGKIRVVRPMSRMRPSLPSRTGMMSASQAILRMVAAVTGPVKAGSRCLLSPRAGPPPWPLRRRGGVRAGEEVVVVDGDHDLGPESAGGGQGAGGEGDFAGADEAVEELLRPGAPVQRRGPAAPAPRLRRARSPAPVPGAAAAAERHRAAVPLAPARVPVRGCVGAPGAGRRCGGWWRCS